MAFFEDIKNTLGNKTKPPLGRLDAEKNKESAANQNPGQKAAEKEYEFIQKNGKLLERMEQIPLIPLLPRVIPERGKYTYETWLVAEKIQSQIVSFIKDGNKNITGIIHEETKNNKNYEIHDYFNIPNKNFPKPVNYRMEIEIKKDRYAPISLMILDASSTEENKIILSFEDLEHPLEKMPPEFNLEEAQKFAKKLREFKQLTHFAPFPERSQKKHDQKK